MQRVYEAEINITGIDDQSIIESFDISMALNSGATGTVEVFGTTKFNPRFISLQGFINGASDGSGYFSFLEGRAPYSERHASLQRIVGVTLRDYITLFNEEAIMPDPPKPPFVVQAKPYGAEALLGAGLLNTEECDDSEREGVRSNLQVANEMLAHNNGLLVVKPGPGLVSFKPVSSYEIEGKTIIEVLNELVLTNNVRWWLEDDALIVDGRPLPIGDLVVPANDVEDILELSFQDEFVEQPPEPLLEDFTDECKGQEDDDEDGTFETLKNATFENTSEPSGDDKDFEYSRYKITKRNGVVVEEIEDIIGKAGVLNTITKTYEYHPLVPDALVRSTETNIKQPRLLYSWSAGDGGIGVPMTLAGEVYSVSHVESEVITEQEWHADGYLKKQVISTREFAYYATNLPSDANNGVTPMYRYSYKTTHYTPTSNGQWLFSVRNSQAVQRVKTRLAFGPSNPTVTAEVIFDDFKTFTSGGTTDQAPPTISLPLPECGDLTCLQKANRDYQRAYQDWGAQLNNAPDKRAYTVTFKGLKPSLAMGELYGGAMITSVNHRGGRGAPAQTTITAEVQLGFV